MSQINILNPGKIWIDKRCYRILMPTSSAPTNYIEDDDIALVAEDLTYKDDLDCGLDVDIPIEQLNSGKMRSSFAVASAYLSYLIGTKGATKRRIENETNTQIKIPSKGQIGDVVVIGNDVKSVRKACIKLELLIDQVKKKQPFTHFISIPFTDSSIQERFLKFKNEVLEKCGNSRGIDASLFQNSKKLHLTLCVLVLADDRERHESIEVLKSHHKDLMEQFICGETITVEVKGIEYMNDDPGAVDVLYAKVLSVSWSQSLQEMADSIVSKLAKAGVATKQHEQVKLHITLMNTLFRSDSDGTDETLQKKERETFDAREILKEFKEYSFGEAEISELHLSVRYTTSRSGYYVASCKLPLHGNN